MDLLDEVFRCSFQEGVILWNMDISDTASLDDNKEFENLIRKVIENVK